MIHLKTYNKINEMFDIHNFNKYKKISKKYWKIVKKIKKEIHKESIIIFHKYCVKDVDHEYLTVQIPIPKGYKLSKNYDYIEIWAHPSDSPEEIDIDLCESEGNHEYDFPNDIKKKYYYEIWQLIKNPPNVAELQAKRMGLM